MKNITIVIPDRFADWEYSLIAPVLHSFTTNYRVRYAAADLNHKTSMGALRVIPDLTFAPPKTPRLSSSADKTGAS